MIIAASRALVKILVPQSVDIDALMDVYDNGEIITVAPLEAWPQSQGKQGLGLGELGAGPLGYGFADGPGLGDFPLGCGPLGVGQAYIEYLTPRLDDGAHDFEVVVADAADNSQEPIVSAALVMAGTPAAPSDLRAAGSDGVVTLSWTKSIDDNS